MEKVNKNTVFSMYSRDFHLCNVSKIAPNIVVENEAVKRHEKV